MKRVMAYVVVAGALAFGAGLSLAADAPAGAGDQKAAVEKVTLPDAAAAAITKAFPKATVGKVALMSTRGDVKNFMAELTEGDNKCGVRVTEAGLIVSITTPIKIEDLPKVVADAIPANSDGAKVDKASKVEWRANRQGTEALETPTFSYAIRLLKDDQVGILNVADDGTVRRPPRFQPIQKEAAPAPATTAK